MDLVFCKIPIDIIEIVVKYTDCDTYFLLRDLSFAFSKKLCNNSTESRILYFLKEKKNGSSFLIFNYHEIKHNEYDNPYMIWEDSMYFRKLGERYRINDLPDGIINVAKREWSDPRSNYRCTKSPKYDLPNYINILTGLCHWEEGIRYPVESRLTIE